MKKNVVVIGAGASGLICAAEAGGRNRSVLLLDHAAKIGSKIRVSGGGRCNFTNLHVSADHYLSQNPHFCKSALSRYTPGDITGLLRRHRIAFHEKEAGQLFCDGSSSELVRALEADCRLAGVEFHLNCRVKKVLKNSNFTIITDTGAIEADSVVVATGGLSYPKLGASNFGLRLAERFGINVISPRPGLVPLTFSKRDIEFFRGLSGVSLNAEVSGNRVSFRGSMLFTHRGLSGPAILQISSCWNRGDIITVNLLPDLDAEELLFSNRISRKEIQNFLSQYLPSRFIHAWCCSNLQTKPLCRFTDRELKEAAEKLSAWQLKPETTEGYGSAEVTVGGIDTNEISSRTMESKKVPGLYFIGEVLDVTGRLGGYNLHWAWASGYAAGQVV